jgi:hypothetical protein
MKKSVLILFAIAAVALLFSCASAPQEKEPEKKSNLPEFVINPPLADDAIYGVGFGDQSTPSLSIKVAEANARADIANQIEAQIKSAVTSYTQESGVDDETQVINFAEQVTRQVTDTTLKGARTKQRAIMDDGSVWVLMQYSKNSFLEAFEQAAEETAEEFKRNESAAFANFKADQALEQLEYETENNPTKSEPVREQ